MYKNVKSGWYELKNSQKFIKPIDEYMQSYKDGHIQYKSSLEENAFRYADNNINVTKFSIEPFHIKYLKPTDRKIHRYYIDMFLEIKNELKFIVEIKSTSQTIPPKKPYKKTAKSMRNYQRALGTYMVNRAKWLAAEEFAEKNDMRFIILTEKNTSDFFSRISTL